MSFMNFSLCPGGAFMMHESVTEFDPIAAEVAQTQTPVLPKEEVAAVAVSLEHVSPVVKLANRLKPCYDKANALMNLDLTADDSQSIMERFDYISDCARDIAEMARGLLVKFEAIDRSVNNDAFRLDPVIRNGKFFVEHKQQLHQQGKDLVTITRGSSPATASWSICRAVGIYFSMHPGIPTTMLNLDTIMPDENPISDRFSDVFDFINCMLYDPERAQRLTRVESNTMNVYYYAFPANIGDITCASYDCTQADIANIISNISSHLRQICGLIYDSQCKIMNGEYDQSTIRDALRTTTVSVVNLFAVAAMLLITLTYDIQNQIEAKTQVEGYVNNLLFEYRSKQ